MIWQRKRKSLSINYCYQWFVTRKLLAINYYYQWFVTRNHYTKLLLSMICNKKIINYCYQWFILRLERTHFKQTFTCDFVKKWKSSAAIEWTSFGLFARAQKFLSKFQGQFLTVRRVPLVDRAVKNSTNWLQNSMILIRLPDWFSFINKETMNAS